MKATQEQHDTGRTVVPIFSKQTKEQESQKNPEVFE